MNPFSLSDLVKLALLEDVGPGDLTTALTVDRQTQGLAALVCREEVVVSGLAVAEEVLRQVDRKVIFTALAHDGQALPPGGVLAELAGPAASILTAERVSLNFLMRLSGIATQTARFAAAVSGTKARIVDTRKTTPSLRFWEKAAVRHGGGHNHRFALYDAILIKDNHVAAAGSIAGAVKAARTGAPHGFKVQVEVDDLAGLAEALRAGAEAVLLDNMEPWALKTAVETADKYFAPQIRPVVLEASGGVTLAAVRAIAESGVDLISVGALTHSVKAVDLALDWR